jgi:methyl coenzyme M reductase alpha subunit
MYDEYMTIEVTHFLGSSKRAVAVRNAGCAVNAAALVTKVARAKAVFMIV